MTDDATRWFNAYQAADMECILLRVALERLVIVADIIPYDGVELRAAIQQAREAMKGEANE